MRNSLRRLLLYTWGTESIGYMVMKELSVMIFKNKRRLKLKTKYQSEHNAACIKKIQRIVQCGIKEMWIQVEEKKKKKQHTQRERMTTTKKEGRKIASKIIVTLSHTNTYRLCIAFLDSWFVRFGNSAIGKTHTVNAKWLMCLIHFKQCSNNVRCTQLDVSAQRWTINIEAVRMNCVVNKCV